MPQNAVLPASLSLRWMC